MRQATQTSPRQIAPQPPARPTFSFECSCCGVTEVRPTPDAPAGWEVHYFDDGAFVFCPQDALNRPLGDLQ